MESYKQEKIIIIMYEYLNDKREFYPISNVPLDKAKFFYKDDDGLFKLMAVSDYTVKTELNENRLYIVNAAIKDNSEKFQIGYEINFKAAEYESPLPVLSVLTKMYNQLIEDTRILHSYIRKQCFVADGKEQALVLPGLPAHTVWCMGENGKMFALPVSELYGKFQQMIDTLHKEIKKLLDIDLKVLSDELKKQLAEHVLALTNELNKHKTELNDYTQEKIKEIQATCERLIDLAFNKLTKADTILELQSRKNLEVGDIVEVLGYYSAGDGATHKRIIANEDDGSGVQLANGLWANIVKSNIYHSTWFGANKSGDVTDIFKKMISYNKPLIVDNGKYNVSEFIFDTEKIIIENNGIFQNKEIIRTIPLKNEKPKFELLEVLIPDTDVTFRAVQGACYNDVREEYVIPCATTKKDELSILYVFDKNLNYLRKKELSLDHASQVVFKKNTNEYIVVYDFGYNGVNKNNYLAILDADTLDFKRDINMGSIVHTHSYDNKNNILATFNWDSCKLFDENLELIKEIKINNNDKNNIVYQGTAFFEGKLIYLFSDDNVENVILRYFDLNGNLIREDRYFINDQTEIEGLALLPNGKLLTLSYNGTILKLYEIDFNAHSYNAEDIITHIGEAKYFVNSSAQSFGDGTEAKPFKTINQAINIIKKNRIINATILTEGEFNENIDVMGLGKIRIDGQNKSIINGNFIFVAINWLQFQNFIINATNAFYITGAFISFSNITINSDGDLTGTVWDKRCVSLYNCIGNIEDITINNANVPFYFSQGSNIVLDGVKGTGNRYKYFVRGAIAMSNDATISNTEGNVIAENGQIFGEASPANLNTYYMGTKMQQEGVHDDFISYMDEKTSYDKQQRKLEQDRQLAYKEALKENPNLTYEEFMSVQPMTLNLIEEPQPSEALKKFMEKYL